MLVITHQIINENLSLERVSAALSNDSIDRTSLTLVVNENDFLNGGSLFNSLESIEYCRDALRWHHLKSLPSAEVIKKFYSPSRQKRLPFDPASAFTPYLDLNP